MMKELYDISVLFLRFLRDFEKWSWILSLRKNEEKLGKIGENGCSRIPNYILLTCEIVDGTLHVYQGNIISFRSERYRER